MQILIIAMSQMMQLFPPVATPFSRVPEVEGKLHIRHVAKLNHETQLGS